jgi:hypothetical protein
MWYQERRQKCKETTSPKFQMCCGHGKVQLPLLKQPPQILGKLLFDTKSKESKLFQQNIRMYNSMFAFTSPGMKFDKNFKGTRGPPVLRLQGQPCHRIGSMLPKEGEAPRFAQLYIYDTDNEIQNRIKSCRLVFEIKLTAITNFNHFHYPCLLIYVTIQYNVGTTRTLMHILLAIWVQCLMHIMSWLRDLGWHMTGSKKEMSRN